MLCRLSASSDTPSVEGEQTRNAIRNSSFNRDRRSRNTARQPTERIAKLTYLVIQIALFVLQSGPGSCAHQRASQAATFSPAPGLLGKTETIGDFDGDRLIDRAEFHKAGGHRCIRVRFGNERETHLIFSTPFFPHGTLLTRDINNDHKPDLIWIFHYKVLPAVIWLGDGLGHFERATSNEDLHELIFGYPGAKIVNASSKDATPSLIDSPIYSELLSATNLKAEFPLLFVSTIANGRRDLGLYLSYLRERGPPPFSCQFS
jgi:hypothetical protein